MKLFSNSKGNVFPSLEHPNNARGIGAAGTFRRRFLRLFLIATSSHERNMQVLVFAGASEEGGGERLQIYDTHE